MSKHPAQKPPSARLLMVELAAVDRFHRAVLFPFVKGFARSAGVETRWMRFAVPASSGLLSQTAGVPLSDRDIGALLSNVETFRPDAIIFSLTPSEEVLQAAASGGSSPRIAVLSGGKAETARPDKTGSVRVERLDLAATPLDGFLGLNDPSVRGSGLFENVTPDYGFEPANDAAKSLEPLPFVFMGEECTYSRSFSSNPFFASLSLAGCTRKGGCAFCTRPENRGRWKTDPLAMLRLQLDAIARTLPATGRGLKIRLAGESVIENIRSVAAEALRFAVRPLDLLIDSRADRFVNAADQMRKALELLASSGCRIQMSLMGVENFCSVELSRLNKGSSPAVNIRAIQQLFELEQAFGDNFGFREYGGLSMITYTPWTAPTELALNLSVVRLLGIEDLVGKLLTGRLRLYEGLPLTEAARRDGLVVHEYEDPLLDTSRLNMYEPEIPWKFQHPQMDGLNRVLVRLAVEALTPDDPVVRAIESSEGAISRGMSTRTVDGALALLDRAVEAGWSRSYPEPETIVQEAASRLEASAGERTAPHERWTRYEDLTSDGTVRIGNVDVGVLLSLKPVIKLEPVSAGDRDRFERDPAFTNTRCRRRGEGGPEQVWEVFFGRNPADVEVAIAETDRIDRERDGLAFADAIARVGTLLGYPPCCARAFADGNKRIIDNYFWLQVARRIESPGEVPFEINPVANPLIEYIPCSLSCAASLQRARRLLSESGLAEGAAGRALLDRLQNPVLFFWSVQGHAVELVPQEEPSERFQYRAGLVMGSGPLIEAVSRGDELVMDAECLTVLKDGRPLASLSGRAFLWWHKRSFQAEFWRAMVDFVRAVDVTQQAEPAPPIHPTAFASSTLNLLGTMKARGVSFEGFAIEKTEITGPDRVRAVLRSGHERVVLDIGPRLLGGPSYIEVGPFILTYPLDCPIETDQQRKAVRAFASALLRIARQTRLGDGY